MITKSRSFLALLALAVLPIAHASAAIVTQWSFTAVAGAGTNSPAPSTGVGTASALGMTNGYNYTTATPGNAEPLNNVPANTPANYVISGVGATNSDDVLSSPGVGNVAFVEDSWRIRGVKNATNGNTGSANNGWNLSAPQYSQGAEFDVPTVGYNDIKLSFDWYSTTQGVKDLQVQYTLDGSTWNNFGALLIAASNDWYGGAAATVGTPNITEDLSSITGAANNPLFGVRLVSAYDPTLTPTPASGGGIFTSGLYGSGAGGVNNNNSGNWRFDNITISGDPSAVPEPASLTLLAIGAAGLMARRRRA